MSNTQRTSLSSSPWIQQQYPEVESPNWRLDVGVTRDPSEYDKSNFSLDVENIGTNFPEGVGPPGEDNEKSNYLPTPANGRPCASPSIGSETTLVERLSQRSRSLIPPMDEDGRSMPPSSEVKAVAPTAPSQELPTIVTEPPSYTPRQTTTFPQRMSKAQAKLTDMRDRTVARRDNLRQRRQKIRDMRREAGDLEARLVKLLQQNRATPQELKIDEIDKMYTDLQGLRDELGHAEVGYDEEEAAYEVLETRLDAMESDFYDDLAEGFSEADIVSLAYSSRPSTPHADQPFSPSDNPSQSPRDQYLQKTIEISMLKEKMGEMQREKNDVLQEQQMRSKYGRSLAEEDIVFLDEFGEIYRQKLRELQKLEEEVQWMEQQHGQLKFQAARRHQEGPSPTTSEPSFFIIHSNPSSPRPVNMDSEAPKALSEAGKLHLSKNMMSTRFRVNQWIIDQILSNPTLRIKYELEIPRLRRSHYSDQQWWEVLRQITTDSYWLSPHNTADDETDGRTSAYTATV